MSETDFPTVEYKNAGKCSETHLENRMDFK